MAPDITRRSLFGALAGTAAALHVSTAQAAEKLRVGKAVVENIGFVPLDIGIETGMFERNGLTIEKVDFGGAARLHQAMTADSVDIGLSAGPEIAFIAKERPRSPLLQSPNRPRSWHSSLPANRASATWTTSKGSGLASPASAR